jgi:hypothetical protein
MLEWRFWRKSAGRFGSCSQRTTLKHYATIGWVARVRLADGRIVVADEAPVLAEAIKFSAKFKAEGLALKPPTKAD